MFLHYGDLSDSTNLFHIISQVRPHELYNLGAMSHVAVSFEMSEYTADVDGIGKFITRLHSRDYSLILTHLQVH